MQGIAGLGAERPSGRASWGGQVEASGVVGRGLKYDIPGDDWRRGVDEVAVRGWDAIFAPELKAPLKLIVEVGFGRGEFLLDLAAKNPDSAFAGVEISFKRTLKMARRLSRSGLRNIRLLEGRGEFVVERLLSPASVQQIWVNFSDPWPKGRHAGRRVIQRGFVRAAACALVPRGSLLLATDDVSYARQIDALLSDEPWLENRFAPAAWRAQAPDRIETGYQNDWIERDRPLHFFEYTRRVAAVSASTCP
jgi:tRNA (guanine-N7-)-methyltransferase